MFERSIGRVINVDSFRVTVELDNDIKSLYKSGYQDIYEIARINSYVILPIGSERIVALITKVRISDETELELSSNSISLPKSKRYLIATMIGTIDSSDNYVQGVYNFPILDNPVWYIMKEELEIIFDQSLEDELIDFKKDYFLPIGKSPAFFDFDIKINPDKFFGKHAAILGNTGSGKSCTISSILQTVFKTKYRYKEGNTIKSEYIKNAHIIVFDTNGEYSKAFTFDNPDLNNRVNTFKIDKDGIRVPFWFMNYNDFDYLFKPSEQTQSPILKKAIAIAKSNTDFTSGEDTKKEINITETLIGMQVDNIINLINSINIDNGDFKLKNYIYHELPLHSENAKKLKSKYSEDFEKLLECKSKLRQNGKYVNGPLDFETLSQVLENLISKREEDYIAVEAENKKELRNETNIDIPGYFNFIEIINTYIDAAIDDIGESKSKYKEYLSSLKMRLSSFYADDRFNIPFMLKEKDFNNSLAIFLKYLVGVLSLDDNELKEENIFTKYKFQKEEGEYKNISNSNNISQISILDMSLLPYEVLENITGLIARLILEFLQRIEKVKEYKDKRGKLPIVLVLEEAQNYIPEIDENKDRISISKKIFQRIAREGRKYGLSLVISSQRPSELSRTILSQCNTFIVHRLQNPEDQRYINKIVSSANEDILNQLSVLPQRHAIIMGDAVRSPVLVRINEVNPKPDSDDPEFFRNWIKEPSNDIDFNKVTDNWLKR
ncbi:DUF87 domain-containing protein [Crassaminicella thermophila]|uniref:DUF87 domain-containing protein n=1 Tax=Crassaminicella thermophila TaxID=2599308 RepID=A0A5C0SFJ0_CRATE|nr:DUF87 domain-containing protein [Crassaminicella thermophila]QEK13141.1 DUF87 domain-containing protein [Crassaminicella thermophila]